VSSYFYAMSSAICSRCQKIYPAALAPVKCVNCGGSIGTGQSVKKPAVPKQQRVPTQVVRPAPRVTSNFIPGRLCSQPKCTEPAEDTIKYFYDGKRIIRTPLTPQKIDAGLDFCQKHSDNYVGPEGWTVINKLAMPSLTAPAVRTTTVDSSDGEGCATFIAVVLCIGIAVFVGWLVINLLSGIDWDNGGTTVVKVPTRWRR
jgi:hypothetical protein